MHSLAHFAAGIVPFLSLPKEVTGQAAPLFHGLVALFIIDRAKILLWPSFLVLMQATPEELLEVLDPRSGETVIDRMIREASHFEGVLECKSAHFWGLTFTDYVGSLHIRAKNDANEQHIIAQAHAKFDPVLVNFTAQVEKDHWDRLGNLTVPPLSESELV
jgi:Co/Zn/Cd efflux system component